MIIVLVVSAVAVEDDAGEVPPFRVRVVDLLLLLNLCSLDGGALVEDDDEASEVGMRFACSRQNGRGGKDSEASADGRIGCSHDARTLRPRPISEGGVG